MHSIDLEIGRFYGGPVVNGNEEPRAPRILVVDDDPLIRRLFGRALGKLGVEGVVVGDGESARQAVLGAEFDLVLLDQHLGNEAGTELVGQLRSVARGTPIWVCISGSLGPAAAPPPGFDGAGAKPATVEKLRALLMQFLGEPARSALTP